MKHWILWLIAGVISLISGGGAGRLSGYRTDLERCIAYCHIVGTKIGQFSVGVRA